MTTPNATDCIDYIEQEFHIHLYNYQKKLIIAWFDGKEVAMSRCMGRTMCKDLVKKYLEHWISLLDPHTFVSNPDIKITYHEAIDEKAGIISQKWIDEMRSINPQIFEKEFELEY